MSPDIFGKYLEFLKELVPGLSDVGGIIDPGHPVSQVYRKAAEDAAIKLGLTMHHAEVRAPDDIEKAFAAMSAAREGRSHLSISIHFCSSPPDCCSGRAT